MCQFLRTFLLCCMVLSLAASAQSNRVLGDEPIPPTNAELEQRIREIDAKLELLKTGQIPADAPPPEGFGEAIPVDASVKPRITAGWDDGFVLRSSDERFLLRITGQVQTDYRGYLNDGDRVDIDAFTVRRARLGIEANVLKYYEFRFLPDFGVGQARIQDAFFNLHYWDQFQVEIGKFKQPFSYEQLIQDRFVPIMERSLIDQLVPARDVGVMLHGQKLLNDRFDWGVSVSNGERDGDTDTNDYKDAALRIVVRPFRQSEQMPSLQRLQLGFAFATGVQQESTSSFQLRTPAGVPFFRFLDSVRADGLRNRWSPEFAYFLGGFGFAAQYFKQTQEFQASNGMVVDVPFEGFYFMSSWLLTGEQRTTYSQAIDPLQPFDPRAASFGPGAWELVGRVSRIRLGRDVFSSGGLRLADPSRYSNGATELTLGFNWYLNKWVRGQFNWERSWFDQPVRLGPANSTGYSTENAVMARLQIMF
jgi:phosphate-selective porin OprO/OprP